jgi:hypothetical protein
MCRRERLRALGEAGESVHCHAIERPTACARQLSHGFLLAVAAPMPP